MWTRVAEAKDEIVASDSPDFDRYLKGMIRAYQEVLEFKPDPQEEDFEDEVSE